MKKIFLASTIISIGLIISSYPSAQIIIRPSGGGVTGGTCPNQAVTAIDTAGVPTCTTITSSYVSNTIALTGTDINTSNQVMALHLTTPYTSSTIVTKTANYTAVCGDAVVATSGTFTVTLPLASSNTNCEIPIINAGSGTVTAGRTSSDLIGNQAETSQTLNPGDALTFKALASTTTWYIKGA